MTLRRAALAPDRPAGGLPSRDGRPAARLRGCREGAARRLARGAAGRARGRHARVPQLPALPAAPGAGRALAVHPARWRRDAVYISGRRRALALWRS